MQEIMIQITLFFVDCMIKLIHILFEGIRQRKLQMIKVLQLVDYKYQNQGFDENAVVRIKLIGENNAEKL